MIMKGDIVKFKPKWQCKDESIVFIAVENEANNLVTVEAQTSLCYNPQHTVRTSMIVSNS